MICCTERKLLIFISKQFPHKMGKKAHTCGIKREKGRKKQHSKKSSKKRLFAISSRTAADNSGKTDCEKLT